ncbi:hypothetical protein [Sphingobacterium sp. HMA12]|uniref:hypothetical protein n=1 Tax=Sphingobacterium sp. HMA12 TaxID=2050894 RepID=UPI000CEA1B0B|nr:hypothetical protein [Sphingobacterium sp. HMA12]
MTEKVNSNQANSGSNKKNGGVGPDPIKMKYFEFEVGSFGSTFEERLEKIRAIGRLATEDFENKYHGIREWFSRYDQISILSFGFYYFLLSDLSHDEEAVKGELEFSPYFQELLQAFALTMPQRYEYRPFSEEVNKFRNDFQEIGELDRLKHYNIPESAMTMDDIFRHQLRTDIMMHTTAVRNWSYEHKMIAVTLDLALGVRDTFIEVHGFDPYLFLKIMYRMREEVESRANLHRQKTVAVIKAENYEATFEQYEKAFPVRRTSTEERKSILDMAGMDLMRLKSMFLMHSDMFLERLFSFDFDSISILSDGKISVNKVEEIFTKISLRFGDLADHNPKHFLLTNPIHECPFIRLNENTIFSTMWSIITHLSIGILEKFCSENEKLRKKYNEVRASYLEDKVMSLFRSSFPTAEIYAGSKWTGKDGKVYENDLLVIVDNFAFVVESKSGQVSASAKRGAPDRLFKTLQELIEEPSDQALRFIEYLKDHPNKLVLPVKKGPSNRFDASRLKYFIPLGVTLSHLGMTSSNLKQLIRAGVTTKPIEELAPSVNLTDLESVFDLLPLASQKLHYFQRRRELEANMEYIGDELDLLAWYLDDGFNFSPEMDKYGFINVTSKSKELDNYIIGSANSEKVEKPELRMTKWWKDILTRIEDRKFQSWLEVSYILLNIPISGQEHFEKEVNALKQKIHAGRAEFPHNWILMSSQEEKRRFYIAGYCYVNIYYDERNDAISDILHSEETNDGKGVLVVGMNIDKEQYPYSILGCRLSSKLFDNKYLKMVNASNNM